MYLLNNYLVFFFFKVPTTVFRTEYSVYFTRIYVFPDKILSYVTGL